MILIGENLNIMSGPVSQAMQKGDAGPIIDIARRQSEAGMDYIDINIGPARRDGIALMRRLITILQDAVDIGLSLDTTNMDAMEAGLAVCRAPALINSVSLQSSRIERGLEIAAKYGADVIGLLWSNEGMPRDANERAMHAVDFIYRANRAGIPDERIWIDPIVSPVSVDHNQVKACTEFIQMLPDIAPECRSIIGLSNISNGTPSMLRGWLNRTYLVMLLRYGLSAAIVDAFDTELIDIARNRRPDIVNLIYRAMEGDLPDINNTDASLLKYARTVRVLTGDSLYSHSWLEA